MIIITDQHNVFSLRRPTQYGTDPFKAHPLNGNSVRHNTRMVTGHQCFNVKCYTQLIY